MLKTSKKKQPVKNKQISLESRLCLTAGTFLKVNDEGNVVAHQPQDHKIQHFFRKLKFKIPEVKMTTLDEIGSRIVLNIEKGRTIPDIADDLEEEFESRIDPLYPRLLQYLNQLQYLSIIEINPLEED